jgi:3-hexulose-6-phosphate synthase
MTKPLIQMALDSLDFDATVALATQVAPYVDIFEIGTPCIKHNGVNLVREMRSRFPDKLLLVDLKTMDAGEYEATPFYAAGADICTVLGSSGPATCAGVIKAANAHGAEAQIDLINVSDKVACARESAKLGAHIIGVHTIADLQAIAKLGLDIRISIAGGIKQSVIQQAAQAGANIIVVGAAIHGAASPAEAAREINQTLVIGGDAFGGINVGPLPGEPSILNVGPLPGKTDPDPRPDPRKKDPDPRKK